MNTWKQDRHADFLEAIQELGGVEISRNGITKTGMKAASKIIRQMTESRFMPEDASRFELLREDFVTLGLSARMQFTCEGVSYEIGSVSDDSSDAVIGFTANKVK